VVEGVQEPIENRSEVIEAVPIIQTTTTYEVPIQVGVVEEQEQEQEEVKHEPDSQIKEDIDSFFMRDLGHYPENYIRAALDHIIGYYNSMVPNVFDGPKIWICEMEAPPTKKRHHIQPTPSLRSPRTT
jgi:hypothetical protein